MKKTKRIRGVFLLFALLFICTGLHARQGLWRVTFRLLRLPSDTLPGEKVIILQVGNKKISFPAPGKVSKSIDVAYDADDSQLGTGNSHIKNLPFSVELKHMNGKTIAARSANYLPCYTLSFGQGGLISFRAQRLQGPVARPAPKPTTPTNPTPKPLAPAKTIDPGKYLPSMRFDGKDNRDSGEKNFPQRFDFDGTSSTDDACENLIRYKIGSSVRGTGRTGKKNRGPNDQRPAVYFHYVRAGQYDVYEYWLYYADNDWANDHEHDWEKYFVYEENGQPKYIYLSCHSDFNPYEWNRIPLDRGHPKIEVDGGSHAMGFAGLKRKIEFVEETKGAEDGVFIRYNGYIHKMNGRLDEGHNKTIPWLIFSNDSNVSHAQTYNQSPDTFNFGDPVYKWANAAHGNEYGDKRPAPWKRDEWNSPPIPNACRINY